MFHKTNTNHLVVRFTHPQYLYEWKLTLQGSSTTRLVQVTLNQLDKQYSSILSNLILTSEEKQLLSIIKHNFVREYRKLFDGQLTVSRTQKHSKNQFIGQNAQNQLEYFLRAFQEKSNNIKQFLKIFYIFTVYLTRTNSITNEVKSKLNQQFMISFTKNYLEKFSQNTNEQYTIFLHMVMIINELVYGINLRNLKETNKSQFKIYPQQNIKFYVGTMLPSQKLQSKESATNLLKFLIILVTSKLRNPKTFYFWTCFFEMLENIKKSLNEIEAAKNQQNQTKNNINIKQLQQSTLFAFIVTVEESEVSILSLIIKLLQTQTNILVVYKFLQVLNQIFEQTISLNNFLIISTQCINFHLPQILAALHTKIKTRAYDQKQCVDFSIVLNNDIKSTKIPTTKNKLQESIYKKVCHQCLTIINKTKEIFDQIKLGKIDYRKYKKVTRLVSQQPNHEVYSSHEKIVYVPQRIEKDYATHIKEQIQMLQNQSEKLQAQQVILVSKQQVMDKLNELDKLQKKVALMKQLSKQQQKHIHDITKDLGKKSELIDNLQNTISNFYLVQSQKGIKNNKIFNKVIEFKLQGTPKLVNSQAITTNESNAFILPLHPSNPSSITNVSINTLLPPPPPPPSNPPNITNVSINTLLPPPPPPPSTIILPPAPKLLLPTPPKLGQLGFKQSHVHRKSFKVTKTQRQMKTIGWTMIQVNEGSFWSGVNNQDQQLLPQTIQASDLLEQFSKQKQNVKQSEHLIGQNAIQYKSLLKSDRAKNVEIVLQKFKINSDRLAQIVIGFNQQYFMQDTINCMQNILPGPKQFELYADINIPLQQKSQWNKTDYYFSIATKITNFSQRLRAINFKFEFENLMSSYYYKVNFLINAFTGIYNDPLLKIFMVYLLKVGNFLNEGSNRGGAMGFKLDGIEKTCTLYAKDHKTTLFVFILQSILRDQKDGSIMMQIIQSYQKVKNQPIISMSQVFDEFNLINKEFQNIQQCLLNIQDDYKSRLDPDVIIEDRVSQYFLSFYAIVKEEIILMKQKRDEMSALYKKIQEYYCQKIQNDKMMEIIKKFRQRVCQFMKNKSFVSHRQKKQLLQKQKMAEKQRYLEQQKILQKERALERQRKERQAAISASSQTKAQTFD